MASPFAAGWDLSVIVDNHVSWDLLTADQQADILANFPVNNPGGRTALNAAQAQKWLDNAYFARVTVAQGIDPLLGD